MEKTNELNKFLSYIHMGSSIYRIYDEASRKLNVNELVALMEKVKEIFKKHEDEITETIHELGEDATESLTFAGVMGVYKENLKSFDNEISILTSAIKSTSMGLISALKFLDENQNLELSIKQKIIEVIRDYEKINQLLVAYSTHLYNN